MSKPIDIPKPNIFRDNAGLNLDNELRFILSQYADYEDAPYDKKLDIVVRGKKYTISFTITPVI